MINQQEGTKAGVSRNDLGAPFSLSALCEELAYSPPPLAGDGTACGHCHIAFVMIRVCFKTVKAPSWDIFFRQDRVDWT